MQMNQSTPGGDPRWGVAVPMREATWYESLVMLVGTIGFMVWLDNPSWPWLETLRDRFVGWEVGGILWGSWIIAWVVGSCLVLSVVWLIQAMLRPQLKLKQTAGDFTCFWQEYRIKKGAQLALSVDRAWVLMDPKPGCTITLTPGKHMVMLCSFKPSGAKDNPGQLIARVRIQRKINVKT